MKSPGMHRRCLTFATAVTGLVLLNLWALSGLISSRRAADETLRGTSESQRIADRISILRNQRSVASTKVVSDSDLVQKLESAARAAQIPANQLIRISPEAPARYKDSVYLEQPVNLALNQVTLPQLTQLFSQIIADADGLRVQSLRLSAPREPGEKEMWKAEVTISYWIYAPALPKTGNRS